MLAALPNALLAAAFLVAGGLTPPPHNGSWLIWAGINLALACAFAVLGTWLRRK